MSRLDPQTGEVVHFPLQPESVPIALTVGGDGWLYFTSSATGGRGESFIGRFNPQTGELGKIPLPADVVALQDIVTGGDGAVYFTYRDADDGRCAVGRIEVCSGETNRGVAACRARPRQPAP